MSVEAITWALRVPVGGNAKVVLLGLANHAHPDGSETYPALDTLAEYASCDRSTARRNLRKLVAEGWAIEDGLGPRGQAKFRLPIGRSPGGSKMQPPQNATRGTGASGGVAPVPPEPSIEPSTSLSARTREARPLFNGKPVDPQLLADAGDALGYYAQRTGQSPAMLNGRGQPSESLKRILGAMTDHPSVRTNFRRVIDATLEAPWWDGPPSVGVIFGPAVIEKSIARASAPPQIGQARKRDGRSRLVRPSEVAHMFEWTRGEPA